MQDVFVACCMSVWCGMGLMCLVVSVLVCVCAYARTRTSEGQMARPRSQYCPSISVRSGIKIASVRASKCQIIAHRLLKTPQQFAHLIPRRSDPAPDNNHTDETCRRTAQRLGQFQTIHGVEMADESWWTLSNQALDCNESWRTLNNHSPEHIGSLGDPKTTS